MDQATERNQGPDVDIIFREPEHIEYAATLGLGVADRAKIVGSRRRSYDRVGLALLAIAWLQTTASALARRVSTGPARSTRPRDALKSAGISRDLRAARAGRRVARRGLRRGRDGGQRSRRAADAADSRPREPCRSSLVNAQSLGECQWLAVRAESGRPLSSTSCLPEAPRSRPLKRCSSARTSCSRSILPIFPSLAKCWRSRRSFPRRICRRRRHRASWTTARKKSAR